MTTPPVLMERAFVTRSSLVLSQTFAVVTVILAGDTVETRAACLVRASHIGV